MKELMNFNQRIDEIFESLKFAKMKKSRFETYVSQNTDLFKLLIAYFLLSKLGEIQAYSAILKVFQYGETPKELAEVDEDELKEAFSEETSNIASQIISISKQISVLFNGEVPKQKENLSKIKELSEDIVNLIFYKYCNPADIYADEKVHRVFNRLGIVKTQNTDETRSRLMLLIPKKYHDSINTQIPLLAKTFCQKEKPLCPFCPINYYCDYDDDRK